MNKTRAWMFLWTALIIALCQAIVLSQSSEKSVGISGTETPASHQSKKQYECYVYNKYVIFKTPTEDGVGEDIRVAIHQPAANAAQSCDIKTAKTHLLIKNDDSNFFFGLLGDYLFVDVGTGPEPRELRIYDVAKKKMIYTAGYSQPIKIGRGQTLDFYKAIEQDLPAKDCPQAKKWEKEGLGFGFEQRVILDLKTLKERPVGKPRCSPRQ